MDDEDVIFEGSPLYEHLVESGCDFDCEKKSAKPQNPNLNVNNSKNDGSAINQEKTGWWEELKRFFNNYIFDESWHKQVKSLHKRSCGHVIDTSLKKQILCEDDATYVESFASSLSDKSSQASVAFSDSLYGQMFLQAAVLCVTIGYGFLRMFYAKSGPVPSPIKHPKSPNPSSTHQNEGICSSMLIYGLDFMSLMVIVAALLPVTVKFSSVGRLVGKLDKFTGCFSAVVSGLENLRKTSCRAVLFVQESEVIQRGYTLVTVPVSRLELGLNSCGRRECSDLRRSIFHRNKNVLLAVREASLSILKLFPNNVELRGVKQCLAKESLKDFCNYLSPFSDDRKKGDDDDDDGSGDDDDEVFKLTEGYSLASLKFLMELTGAHVSELSRLVSLLSLIQTNELSSDGPSRSCHGFHDQLPILSKLSDVVDRNLRPLEQCLAVAQTMRNRIAEGRERKKSDGKKGSSKKTGKNDGKDAIRGMHVALHSMKLHLESALRRVQLHDAKLESLLDDDDDDDDDDNDGDCYKEGSQDTSGGGDASKTTQDDESKASETSQKYGKMVDEISSEAKQLGRELKAGKECLEELDTIVSKMAKKTPKAPGSDQSEQRLEKVVEEPKDIQLIMAGTEPTIEDEFFEGVSGKNKDFKPPEDDPELENTRLMQKDAARVMSELRSVISVRARDMEERERKAFLKKFADNKNSNGDDEDHHHHQEGIEGSHPRPTSNGSPTEESPHSSDPPQPSSLQSVNGRHSPPPNFGARPKDPVGSRTPRSRKDRQYFRDKTESSDSDEGNVSTKAGHLRQRKGVVKATSSPGNESSCAGASMETSRSRESEDSNGINGLFGFRRDGGGDDDDDAGGGDDDDVGGGGGDLFLGGGIHNSDFQSPLTIRGLANMAASLSRRVNLGEEDFYGNDDEDDDDDDDVLCQDEDEEAEEEEEINSESQSDLDSDDIYHVTDDDEGFDGLNAGYDDDDDDEDEK